MSEPGDEEVSFRLDLPEQERGGSYANFLAVCLERQDALAGHLGAQLEYLRERLAS